MSRTGPGGAALVVCGLMGYAVLNNNPGAGPIADAPPSVRVAALPAVLPKLEKPLTAMASLPPIAMPKELVAETRLALLDPSLFDTTAAAEPGPYAQQAPVDSAFVPTEAPQQVAEAAPEPPATPEPVIPLPPVAEANGDPLASIPMPQPRPREFRTPSSGAPVPVTRMARLETQMQAPAPAPVAPQGPTFFDKLFGGVQPSGPALAYAAPETGVISRLQGMTSSGPVDSHATAVYDIAAHTVYLPDGTRLEAHSGLGERLDDPRYVRDRMRGPTPPALYELTLRESLFHGVQALRLTPVSGGDTYGRGGLLAHTFMLGPRGDSNGCVVFRNYQAFLEAYGRGQIRHLQVVASLR